MLGAIEGSSVGVGFQLELGDLVEPAYDAVDLAWRGFFAALALLGLYALALETGLLSLGLSVLGAAALLAGVGLLLPERRLARLASALRGLGTRTALFGAALAYGVPLVLLASQQVASSYLEPLRAKQAAKIEAAAPLLEQVGTRLRAIRERVSLLEPRQSLDAIARETRAIAAQASEIVLERAGLGHFARAARGRAAAAAVGDGLAAPRRNPRRRARSAATRAALRREVQRATRALGNLAGERRTFGRNDLARPALAHERRAAQRDEDRSDAL
jgi:hypothetical protein